MKCFLTQPDIFSNFHADSVKNVIFWTARLLQHRWMVSRLLWSLFGWPCDSVRCDVGQCTSGWGFDSLSTCPRLLGPPISCVGLPQLPLRLSSVFAIPKNVAFSSAMHLWCFCSLQGRQRLRRPLSWWRQRSLPNWVLLLHEIKINSFIHFSVSSLQRKKSPIRLKVFAFCMIITYGMAIFWFSVCNSKEVKIFFQGSIDWMHCVIKCLTVSFIQITHFPKIYPGQLFWCYGEVWNARLERK